MNPTKGSEQHGKSRSCVVIQNDVGKQYSPTTIIAPFTTQYTSGDTYPFEVEVLASDTILDHDSVANLSQIRVVDVNERVAKNIGSVPSSDLVKINSAIKDSLGI
ncbi:type II toxin-antitoxin system PemK/MazF family toxin [Halorubrum laminariae]|uniref:Type II toxin-antitoxin system PemK/MazF family toxin n=1 Tax=Halorubrum laminariae TaxID=1433523 RepID=A0ABD6C619_9EURY|nr:type II toxin-antitoxin system PemK/MazF family toxin [Halorubrum laminariae]